MGARLVPEESLRQTDPEVFRAPRRRGGAEEGQGGRRQVGEAHEPREPGAGRERRFVRAGPGEQQGDAEPLVEQAPRTGEGRAVFAEGLPVESGDDHQRLPGGRPAGEGVEHPARRPVHRADRRVVAVRLLPVAGPAGERGGRDGAVPEHRRVGSGAVRRDFGQVLLAGGERRLRRGEVEPEEERVGRFRAGEDLLGEPGDGVRRRRAGPFPEVEPPVEGAGRAEQAYERRVVHGGQRPVPAGAEQRREQPASDFPGSQPGRGAEGRFRRVRSAEGGEGGARRLRPGGEGFEEEGAGSAEQVEAGRGVPGVAVDPQVVGAERGDGDHEEARGRAAGPVGRRPSGRRPAAAGETGGERERDRRRPGRPGAQGAPPGAAPSVPRSIRIVRAPSGERSRTTRTASALR